MRPPAATSAMRSRAHTSRKTIYGGCCRACNYPRGKRVLRAALRPACGAGCARRGGSCAPAGAGKGYAACGRDGHTGDNPARVKYTACGGSCLMISGAARAGHGDATRCGRITYDPHPTEEGDKRNDELLCGRPCARYAGHLVSVRDSWRASCPHAVKALCSDATCRTCCKWCPLVSRCVCKCRLFARHPV